MYNLNILTMEKKEKLETITKLVGMSGLGRDEVIAYWQNLEKQKAAVCDKPKDFSKITILPVKKIVSPEVIYAGMFLYEDGLIYPEIIEGNQITSVIGYVGKTSGLAVCLQGRELPWSSDFLYAGLEEAGNLSGKEMTKQIIEQALHQGKKAEAAQYCFEYTADGVQAGEAFLPLIKEMDLVRCNVHIVNDALDRLHCDNMWKIFWSSSEFSAREALNREFTGDWSSSFVAKNRLYDVRPFLSFTF